MEKLLDKIEEYWSTRTEGYSEVNHKELEGTQKESWLKLLVSEFPEIPKEEIKILDVGTGPGFFSVILAEAGYRVTAVDYTIEMLEKAAENVGNLCDRVHFYRMDAQKLEFEDNTFDVVISRNLTWNLEQPEQAYREWFRVLKSGGKMLNFDANWYGYLFDEKKREAYEKDRKIVEQMKLDDHYLCTDIDTMEQIALQMPLSARKRPEWDVEVLNKTGFEDIYTDNSVWKRVWSQEEKLNYGSTPMFMINGRKGDREVYAYGRINKISDNRKERITEYWSKRSESFMMQRRRELNSPLAYRWLREIEKKLPEGKKLNILDVGCGSGFFSILLAKKGHEVTGTDLTPQMIVNSKSLAEEENIFCNFLVMDAEKLEFKDQSFDVVISRNLTWTLPHVKTAYSEWNRVLKKGGVLLNFDANYGASNFADYAELPENHAHHTLGDEMMQECEKIKRQLPISSCIRPAWDVETLGQMGFEEISIDLGIGRRIYIEKDEFFNPTPIFMICGKKSE